MSSNGNGNGGGWHKNIPLRYVSQVIQKLEAGIYPTEKTKCFCGVEPNDTVIVERDRYTIPHRMVMCENCLLMRADPRMTKEAYAEFYNNEYRKIYDGFPYQEKSEDDDFLFQLAVDKAIDLKNFLLKWDIIAPKIVVDLGSDKGGTLIPFRDDGAEVYGIEICDSGRVYAREKGITCFRTIEELIEKGIKADLVIMQDMIEHLMDLHEMEKIKEILTPKGYLYIYTPGFLRCDPGDVFQNAHTYQFIGATLDFIMERLGYAEHVLDERIISLWRHVGPPQFAEERPLVWRKAIIEHLQQKEYRSLMPVRTVCKFQEKDMLHNLVLNLSHKIPTISELKGKYSGPCVIVGGGPSVDGQIEKIADFVGKGHHLMVIERMYPWCHQHGLKPDFVVQLDASEGVEEGFTHIDPDAIHFIGATTNPIVFDILKGYKQFIFSGIGGAHPDAQESWEKYGYTKAIIVNTGGSVSLTALSIAQVLGFKDFHLFGFDFMVPSREKTYASNIAGESVERNYIEVEVGENREKVLTCSSFLAFAQQFFGMTETARRWGMINSVEIYGESLITKMFDGGNDNFFNPKQTELSVGA